jgi:phage tail sheath protein FI
MPAALTYPGVYIEEVPSGVRAITGVATSITAFVGRTRRGPVNDPVMLNSWADFERRFGGLWARSPLSFAVRDFYLNGGSQALVVRLFRPLFESEEQRAAVRAAAEAVATAAKTKSEEAAATPAQVAEAARAKADELKDDDKPLETDAADTVATAAEAATADDEATAATVAEAAEAAVAGVAPVTNSQLTVGGLGLQAADPGSWGDRLEATVDHDTAEASLFNLTVTVGDQTEIHRNLSVATGHPRRVDQVLASQSAVVRTTGALPGSRPEAATATVQADGRASDGLVPAKADYVDQAKTGVNALDKADLFNLLCLPPPALDTDLDANVWATAESYCKRRRAFLLVDPPSEWNDKDDPQKGADAGGLDKIAGSMLKDHSAIFFPRLLQPNPTRDDRLESFAPCGAVAGVFARTDVQRGVWKAPAGQEATLVGVTGLTVPLTDAENGELNQRGINCLRSMPASGRVIWGARTLAGADRLASEWKYTPVRRLALFIEESLYRGTQWVVFEPNDEPLWAQIRLNVGTFMHNLFRQGAFQGASPDKAYFVKCDSETTIQADIDLGIVNIHVGFAPLKPAEFVVIKIQQLAGQAGA